MNDIMNAFAGGPKTTFFNANGQTEIKIEASHLRPGDARAADNEAVITVLFFIIGSVFAAIHEQNLVIAVVVAICGFASIGYLKAESRKMATKVATIVFSETTIFVMEEPELFRKDRWRTFDRRHPHRFVLVPHELARQEEDLIQHRQRMGASGRPTRYYSESFFVVLDYLGQRLDLAEVFGQRNANDILARLNLCDEYMKGIADARQMLPTRPEHQWSGATGSIPQD
jgi:hypothetical protein